MSQKGGWEIYWQGAVHFWYSLELVSIDGQVHFFIRVPSRIKKLVETQLYAQFPQVRVYEVPDYTESIPKYVNDGQWHLWGCEYKLEKHDAWSIKTYKDFGLDIASDKEEMKIDPMSGVLEFFGSLERGEQLWLQIIIRQSKKTYHTRGTLFGHHDFYTESELFKLIEQFKTETIADYKKNLSDYCNNIEKTINSWIIKSEESFENNIKSLKENALKSDEEKEILNNQLTIDINILDEIYAQLNI